MGKPQETQNYRPADGREKRQGEERGREGGGGGLKGKPRAIQKAKREKKARGSAAGKPAKNKFARYLPKRRPPVRANGADETPAGQPQTLKGCAKRRGRIPFAHFYGNNPRALRMKADTPIFPRMASGLARSARLKTGVNCARLSRSESWPAPARAPRGFLSYLTHFPTLFCKSKIEARTLRPAAKL